MEQTFVLKLAREINARTDSAQGHIEDVRSGKAIRFHSVSELLIFLEDTMQQNSNPENTPE
jgi:hypothetical protein